MFRPTRPIVFALAATAALTASPPVTRADGPATLKQQGQFEVKFLKGMIDHHTMAVMMAELCDGRAVHQDLIDLCHQILATQTDEIELMQDWLEDWYGVTYEPQMNPWMRKALERLAPLQGAEFEVEFMRAMIRHHEQAVREGEHCVERGHHDQLINLCEDIIAAQTQEIAVMEGWLCIWYGVCEN